MELSEGPLRTLGHKYETRCLGAGEAMGLLAKRRKDVPWQHGMRA